MTFYMGKSCCILIQILLTILIMCLGIKAQSATSPDAVQSLNSMSNSTLLLQSKYSKKSKAIAGKLLEISVLVQEMRAAIKARLPKTKPEIYLENLSAISKLLKNLSGKPPKKELLLKKLEEVASDLALKVAYGRSSRGEPFAQIEAVIRTIKGTNEISSYEVWYVPVALEEYSEDHMRFDNLSSPAVMKLPPGNYLIWAKKGNYKSERRPLTLGNDGSSKRRYDLPVQ
jgi:hypothetical protein